MSNRRAVEILAGFLATNVGVAFPGFSMLVWWNDSKGAAALCGVWMILFIQGALSALAYSFITRDWDGRPHQGYRYCAWLFLALNSLFGFSGFRPHVPLWLALAGLPVAFLMGMVGMRLRPVFVAPIESVCRGMKYLRSWRPDFQVPRRMRSRLARQS